jgi:rhodanese-related sulfurtransferase
MTPDAMGDRLCPGGLPPGYPFKPDLEITPFDARELLRRTPPGILLVDCRTSQEAAVALIAGSMLVPLHEVEARAEEIAAAAERAGDVPVIVHCHHGMRSLRAAIALRQRGLDGVRSLAGGIDLWSRSMDPGVPRYERDAAGGFRTIPATDKVRSSSGG